MKKGREYYRIDDMTKPVLIYKGDDICHNVLTVFAEQFGAALEQEGRAGNDGGSSRQLSDSSDTGIL